MDDFELDEEALNRLVADGMEQLIPAVQARFDSLTERCAGLPLEEAKALVVADFVAHAGEISEPELTDFATRFAAGERIEARSAL